MDEKIWNEMDRLKPIRKDYEVTATGLEPRTT